MGSQWLQRIVAIHRGSVRPAVIDEAGPVTGGELLGKAVAAAESLTAQAAAAGTPVPALLTTNADALALILGGASADRPVAPIGPRLTVDELSTIVRNTGSDVMLCEPQFADTAGRVAEATGRRLKVLETLPVSSRELPAACGRSALFLHTSGTTGAPKAVPFSDQVLVARTEVLSGLTGIGPEHRYASGSPIHHIGGLGNVLVALSVGATILPTSAFSTDWWRGLTELGATHCMLVPSMIEMLLTARLLDAVPLQTLVYGASPITPETLRRVIQVLPDLALVNLFGQTEGSPITALTREDHRRAAAGEFGLLGTVGRAVPGLRLQIDEPDSAGTGEVLARAPHLSSHGADGWLHTGDLGSVDADGYLHLRGRCNDMVVRGGENVYPLEVENVLSTHPAVASVGVTGVPDQRLGEALAAFVVVVVEDPGPPPDFEDLRMFVRARLAGFKVPMYWYVVEALPLNSAGKVVRTTLRDWHAERAH